MEYPRREVASQPVRLAPRPVFLAGREELLADLDTRLAAGDGRSDPRVVALCGLGGAGKTSVALEYAHRHLAEVGLAWQFPAGDPGVVATGSVSWRPSWAPGSSWMRGTRWPRYTAC